jgi:hypothetical protein
MTERSEQPLCPQCGNSMAYRASVLSIHYGFKGHDSEASWKYELICPFCTNLSCYVDGCEEPASTVFAHKFHIHRFRKPVRNDFWVCETHAPLISQYRKLVSFPKYGYVIAGGVLCGIPLVLHKHAEYFGGIGGLILLAIVAAVVSCLVIQAHRNYVGATYAKTHGLLPDPVIDDHDETKGCDIFPNDPWVRFEDEV